MKYLVVALASVALLVVGVRCTIVLAQIPDSPEAALQQFYSASPFEVAEVQLADPLILAGRSAVPLLLSEIASQDMPRRGYAVLALGDIGDPAVVARLSEMVNDPTDNARCDALRAIALIDQREASALARELKTDGEQCLSTLKVMILSGFSPDAPFTRRTPLHVFLGDFYDR